MPSRRAASNAPPRRNAVAAPRPQRVAERPGEWSLAARTSDLLGLSVSSELGLIERVRTGLSGKMLRTLQERAQISGDALGAVVQIPARTLTRRLNAGRLTSEESDRVMRFARLFAQVIALFEGDESAARRWLERPSPALGGATPLSMADTDLGTRAVSDLIGRLEHGIPS